MSPISSIALATWWIGVAIAHGTVNTLGLNGTRLCTVTASGNETDDVPNILKAFDDCNGGGTVVFPEEESYWIASPLNPIINDVTIEWRGQWTMSDDLDYWRNHSYYIPFQNHHASFVLTGDGIHINGYGTGGINGNGNAWYNAEKSVTQPGRPMPFVFWNVSDVTVKSFFVKEPPLWSLNIMNGTNMEFDDIYCNATALSAPYGKNWVQNTDGFDTMDANNIRLTNFVYQGGDDCIAIKPRSYNIFLQNITCHGGNGIAIGSLGQYLEDSSVENVQVRDVKVIRRNDDMEQGAYIKTWIGELAPQASYESAGLPRGGGWGVVDNIRFENFEVFGGSFGAAISQDSGDDANGTYQGTSNMLVSNIVFANWTGYTNTERDGNITLSLSCSARNPCYNIDFRNFTILPGINGSVSAAETECSYIEQGAVHGLGDKGC